MPTGLAIATIGSAAIGAIASNKASKKQSKAQDKAIAAQNRLIGPFSDAGAAGLPAVQSFVDEGARFSDTQAFKDITNSAKAGGQNQSGNRLTALTDYYATNFRPQRLNELMTLPRLGANAAVGQASNIGGLEQNKGTIAGRNITNIGNSITDGINSLGFLNQFNKTQSSGSSATLQPGSFTVT
jgi:hypothetical protein